MFTSEAKKLTDLSRVFLEPTNATHRQYEALRAFFVDGLPSAEAARRFGYTPGSFRVLVHQFRQNPRRDFFLTPAKGPQSAPKTDPLRDRIIALRKQNLSIYDISRNLAHQGHSPQPGRRRPDPQGRRIRSLATPGRRRTPTRLAADHGRCRRCPATRPEPAVVPDQIRRPVPLPADAGLDPPRSHPPGRGVPRLGDDPTPAAPCDRCLALKLFGTARHGHVMSVVLDQGLALFAGLNVIPKRSFLTEYSCRIDPACYPELMRRWFDAVGRLGLPRGHSFDLDFHTIPFHGEDALIEKHYVSKRSRRQKGILAFLVQDAETRVFCYANGELRKDQQNDEILHFVRFWKERTGRYPGRTDLRFQVDDLRQAQRAQPAGDSIHHPAPSLQGADAGDRPDAQLRVATDRVEGRLAAVHDIRGSSIDGSPWPITTARCVR